MNVDDADPVGQKKTKTQQKSLFSTEIESFDSTEIESFDMYPTLGNKNREIERY